MSSRRSIIVSVAGLLALSLGYLALARPGEGNLRHFDPDRLAVLEVDMWQAYYAKERLRLVRGLITTLREQYHCSYANAVRVGFRFGRAASQFATATSDYEAVLPDLEQGFAVVRSCVNAGFNPSAVARAELAWWVARRVPEERSPENVGRLIAEANALIFGVPSAQVLDASVLRARAGRLRDEGGDGADWNVVSDLLHQSYRRLHQAVN